MEYEKMYFPKEEMSQTVPTLCIQQADAAFEAYAESFDLSLLPSDGEVPLSPQSELELLSNNNGGSVSLDYIPATIYHDQPLKIEKPWIGETETLQNVCQSAAATDTSILLQQLQKHYQLYPSPIPSPPQYDSFNHNYPPSPCPSIEPPTAFHTTAPVKIAGNFTIKQEFQNILPPSPPESSYGAPSPFTEIKSEPDTDSETNLIDIDSLLEKSLNDFEYKSAQQPAQDHQLLREYLLDTSFQKKHNLKPLALESLIGGLGARGDIEPVISLALEHAKRDAQAMCAQLKISLDPQQWTNSQVHAWLRSTVEQFKLPFIDDLEAKFPEDGTSLVNLTEEEFNRRVSQAGSTIHAQLEIWKLACTENFSSVLGPSTSSMQTWNSSDCGQNLEFISEDEDDEMANPALLSTGPTQSSTPSTTTAAGNDGAGESVSTPSTSTVATKRTGGSHIHLWQFLKELLAAPQLYGTAIRWIDRSNGIFKIEDSVRVAKLWGRRKNRPAMNYDKLSRSIRQYYKKGIMKKTERSQRLVYQFCHPYCL